MSTPIIMIHGMWGGPWCLEKYRRHLEARGYTCAVPVLRHHESPVDPHLGTTSLLDYARDLEKSVQACDSPPVLFGHSMGGLLAQILAARLPARAIVLVAPAAPAGINSLTFSILKSFKSMLLRWGFWRRPHLPTFDECIYAMWHRLDEDEQRRTYSRLVYESGRASAEIGLWMLDRFRASRVDHSRITCPMLVIGATEDRLAPVHVVKKVAAKYRAISEYKEFAGHAHWLTAEPGWEEPANYIADWLAKQLAESN